MPALAPQQKLDIDAIVRTISEVENLPADAKSLFEESLPHSVAPEGESHAFQKEFVGLAASVLRDAKGSVAEALGKMDGATDEATAALEASKAEMAKFEEALVTAAEEVASAEASLAEAEKVVRAAETEHRQREKNCKDLFQGWEALALRRSKEQAIADGPLRMLAEGGWEGEEVKQAAVEAVVSLLGDIKADKVLVAAAAPALEAKPDSREPFDKLVVETVSSTLVEHLKSLDAKAEEEKPLEDAHKSEILGLWAISDCARDGRDELKRALDGSQVSKMEAGTSVEVQGQEVKDAEGKVTAQAAKRRRLEAQVKEVEDSILAVDRLASGPPPPAVQEEEAAAATAVASDPAPEA